jgi:2-C-methyl-D-erythritol 4-phosphate cytidylyltransferase
VRAVRAWAVVVAGGSGSRFGAPKQFAALLGRRLVEWSLDVANEVCEGVVLVVPPALVAPEEPASWAADKVVAGGATRSASVRCGLAALPGGPGGADVVVVHDAARPLSRPQLWQAVIDAVAAGADAAIPAVGVTDTVKEIGPGGRLVTLDRSRLVSVQTPQAFRAGAIHEAHRSGDDATDDAALVEASGGTVVIVEGPADNIKVTSPGDLVVAEALLRARS